MCIRDRSRYVDGIIIRNANHQDLIELEVPTLDDIKDGPPCLQVLLKQGFPEGTRNNGLFNVGVYLKKSKPESWETEIEEYNRKYVHPPLPAQEVLTLIGTLKKKEYKRLKNILFRNSALHAVKLLSKKKQTKRQ
mgnify:CR=1 FL=1